MSQVITFGILGAGFMGGKTYPRALRTANQIAAPLGVQIVPHMIYVRNPKNHDAVRGLTGIQNVTANPDDVINGCDVICNCLPNNEHLPFSLKAFTAGKHVMCEKPLGDTLEAAETLAAAAKTAGTHTLMGTCYMGADAVSTGRKIVKNGAVIAKSDTTPPWFSGRFSFLQDWRIGFTGNWRFENGVAGPGGILDDLMQHSLSVAFGWLGKRHRVTDVKADLIYADGTNENIRFFDGTDSRAKGLAVDAATALVRFEGGSTLNFETTRFARSHKAFSWAELNGDNGSIAWELQDGQLLKHSEYRRSDGSSVPALQRGWTSIHCSGGEHGNVLSVPGLTQGYETYFANLMAAFAIGIAQNNKRPFFKLGDETVSPFIPDFDFGLFLQRITSTMLASGYEGGVWKKFD